MNRAKDIGKGKHRAAIFMYQAVGKEADLVNIMASYGAFDVWMVSKDSKACTVITQAFAYGGFEVYAPVTDQNSMPATVAGILGRLS